jgi:hypothetical protein
MMLTKQQQFFNINNQTLGKSWGNFGVEISSNLCNALLPTILLGLQTLHPPVQIWVLPSLKT